MTLFYEIFKNDSDWHKWEKHIDFAQIASEIEEPSRQKLIDAFTFLREEFGNGFLKNNFSSEHPLCKKMVFIKDPYSQAWIVWFSNSLKNLKNTNCNYDRLKKAVISTKACIEEGIPFLEIGFSAMLNGFHANFLEEDKKSKKPDIELINLLNGEKVFIEVSMTNELNEEKEDREPYTRLIELFLHKLPRVGFSGKIIKRPNAQELKELINKLTELKQEVFNEKKFKIFLSDVVEIGLTHPDNITEWNAWRESKNYPFEMIISLPIKYDVTRKIRDEKIRVKAKQIPHESIGIIYLHVPYLYMLANEPQKTINEVKKRIKDYSNLFGIIITATKKTGIEGGNERQESNSSFYEGLNFKGILDQRIFVFNDKCRALSPDTTLKLYSLVNFFPSFQYSF